MRVNKQFGQQNDPAEIRRKKLSKRDEKASQSQSPDPVMDLRSLTLFFKLSHFMPLFSSSFVLQK